MFTLQLLCSDKCLGDSTLAGPVLAPHLHTWFVMAEKQSSKGAVKELLEGRMDPGSVLAREITEAVTERVLKNSAATEPSR